MSAPARPSVGHDDGSPARWAESLSDSAIEVVVRSLGKLAPRVAEAVEEEFHERQRIVRHRTHLRAIDQALHDLREHAHRLTPRESTQRQTAGLAYLARELEAVVSSLKGNGR